MIEPARISHHSVMDVLDRVLADSGAATDRIVIITLDQDGETRRLYSNARSEPEMQGMLWSGLTQQRDLHRED